MKAVQMTRRITLAALARRALAPACLLATVLTVVAVVKAQEKLAAQPAPADAQNVASTVEQPASEQPIVKKRAKKAKSKLPERLDEYFVAGGPLMWPIGLCSFLVVVFTIERLVVLRRRRVIPRDFVTRFILQLEQGKLDRRTALKVCEENGSPIAQVFEHAVRKWGKPSVELEQAVIDGGERQVSHLRAHLRVLNAVSNIGPLLGLLGTVLGMIQTFYDIAKLEGAGSASEFAQGIGVAMITTAGGLMVALPAMIIYLYFMGRVDSLVMEMDSVAQKVVNLISAEALANPPMPVRVARPKPLEEDSVSKDRRRVVKPVAPEPSE